MRRKGGGYELGRGSSLILISILLDLRTFDVSTYIPYFFTKILLNLGKK